MKTKKILSTFAILFIALISGCDKDDYNEVEFVCPVVSSTIPVNGSFGVPLNQVVSVIFNEEIDPSTINSSSIIISAAGVAVPGTVTYAGTTATFTPTSRLTTNTLYTGIVKTAVKDVDGNALQTDYVWTFTTGLNPLVVSTDPANGAVDVSPNKIITATFNMSMNPATLNASTFIVQQGTTVIPGTITYAGTMVTFTPTTPLDENKIYTATITKGAENTIGTELASDYVWTFTTGLRPIVVSTDPANNATGVPLNKAISATFNMPMNALTLIGTTFTVNQGTNPVLGIISYSGSTVTFTPSAPLTGNTLYTCTITTDAKNLAGTPLANNYVWIFTTSPVPFVVSTDPANGATGVVLTKVIRATFNMAMNPATLNATTFTVKQGATTVLGVLSYSGTTVSFDPASPLLADKIYTCTITTGAQNNAGVPMASNYVWNFTTGIVPVVVSTDPANNATGVVLNKVIRATFNVPMNPLTLNATTFTVKQGATTIVGAISYSGTTVSFDPATPLLADKIYTCTITTGAQNVAGIPMANNYVWSFTTVVPIIVIPPPVLTTGLFFGVFGGNAGITNQGLFTVINGNIGTTAASTLMTGFKEILTGDVYTVTPLNSGSVMKEIFAAAPAPGNATKAATALAGLNAARDVYLSISPASMPGGLDPGAGELGGLTLAPGVYKSASGTFDITNGDLTLDAQGNPNAIFVFQCASALTVGDSAPSSVRLIGGAQAKNVFWYVGSAAVINYAGGGVMSGNIIANSGVTLSSPANSTNPAVTTLNGRAMSLVSSVTMVNTVINVPN
ncbi:Ig-like domain-containing protein [Flavobacterium sp.]|uniref:Ig-like domain-containing protein n=1 Tax=Flavobacterium sp. TaxID=239 RepID=UPI00286D72A4|nr:Ig-like domain-containing protein [Flavobacterium sp.]